MTQVTGFAIETWTRPPSWIGSPGGGSCAKTLPAGSPAGGTACTMSGSSPARSSVSCAWCSVVLVTSGVGITVPVQRDVCVGIFA